MTERIRISKHGQGWVVDVPIVRGMERYEGWKNGHRLDLEDACKVAQEVLRVRQMVVSPLYHCHSPIRLHRYGVDVI